MSVLDLSVVVTTADGSQTRWGPEDKDAGTVPQGIQFGTQRMGGFSTAGCRLARRIDRDNIDVDRFDRFEIVGADGTTAYDGYVTALPRSYGTEHTLDVQATGWVGHAQDTPFTDIIVDRDLGQWGAVGTNRKANLLTSSLAPQDASTSPDTTTGRAALRLQIDGAWTTVKPIAIAMYDAGPGNAIKSVYYDYTSSQSGGSWVLTLQVRDTDDQTGSVNLSTSGLAASASATGTFTPSTAARFAEWSWYYNASGGADGAQFATTLRDLAVYGNHNLPLIGDTNPKGVAASDVIKYIAATYAPLLNTSGVQATTYPIPHLVWRDLTAPWDAMLDCNAFHLWDLAVWEDRRLSFAPFDLTDWDWEIRTDEPGTTIDLQGDSTTDLVAGVIVKYTNVATGQPDMLHPDDHTELRDTSWENPAVAHGRNILKPYEVNYPTTADAALQIGRAALAEFNQPKAPGSITRTGMIRDDNRAVSISVDATFSHLEGIAHRQQVALAAAGL
jgi:hypothetical protein